MTAIEPGSRAGLARVAHGGEQAADVLELGGRVVEGDDPGAAPERLERVPARPAAHVEQQVALAARRAGRSGRSARLLPSCSRRMRYCSTVFTAVCIHDQRSMMRCRPRAPTVSRRSVCSRAQRILAASASLSPGRHEQGGVAVLADDLGDGPAGGGHERARRRTSPRWPGARSPRRATARRPARPRSRAR